VPAETLMRVATEMHAARVELAVRFARGEIDEEEYRRRRDAIRG